MKAHELAKLLLDMPNVPVTCAQDNSYLIPMLFIWKAGSQFSTPRNPDPVVVLCGPDEVILEGKYRPESAPPPWEQKHWATPSSGEGLL